MKIIKPSHTHISKKGLTPYQFVEKIGRTCYKSEDKITEDSARGFVERLAKSHHFAMLEHGWVDFEITGIDNLPPELEHIPWGTVRLALLPKKSSL